MSVKFTMVIDDDMAKKLDYIAAYNDRSRIKEIVQACKEHIKKFEDEVERIDLSST